MLLINSHFSKNKGTTDFFVDFLLQQKRDFYLLKHPFDMSESNFIELFLFKNGEQVLINKYKKINSNILNLLNDLFVSILISFKLNKKVKSVIGFGSFNVLPFTLTNLFFKRNVIFWGVDYSTKRFDNKLLNSIYKFVETIACKYSVFTINQSPRQEEARIKFHNLKKVNSIVSANGINNTDQQINNFNESETVNLLYVGSITKQHGIIDFIDYFYRENNIPFVLHIVGSGDEEEKLKDKVKSVNDPEKIIFVGYKNQEEIKEYISNINGKIFGIAPYSDSLNDHVYFGDSLKIKEYLLYGIPFIVSSVAYVPDDLSPFGLVYKDFNELLKLLDNIHKFNINQEQKDLALKEYNWDKIFTKIINKIQI